MIKQLGERNPEKRWLTALIDPNDIFIISRYVNLVVRNLVNDVLYRGVTTKGGIDSVIHNGIVDHMRGIVGGSPKRYFGW